MRVTLRATPRFCVLVQKRSACSDEGSSEGNISIRWSTCSDVLMLRPEYEWPSPFLQAAISVDGSRLQHRVLCARLQRSSGGLLNRIQAHHTPAGGAIHMLSPSTSFCLSLPLRKSMWVALDSHVLRLIRTSVNPAGQCYVACGNDLCECNQNASLLLQFMASPEAQKRYWARSFAGVGTASHTLRRLHLVHPLPLWWCFSLLKFQQVPSPFVWCEQHGSIWMYKLIPYGQDA